MLCEVMNTVGRPGKLGEGISATLAGSNAVRVMLDPYNPTGSTRYMNVMTAKQSLWQTLRSH